MNLTYITRPSLDENVERFNADLRWFTRNIRSVFCVSSFASSFPSLDEGVMTGVQTDAPHNVQRLSVVEPLPTTVIMTRANDVCGPL